MSRFDPTIGVRRDEIDAAFDDIQAKLDEGALQTALAVVGVDIPIIDLTTPAVFTDGKKGKIYITLRFTQYGSASDLKVVFVERAQITNATDYDTNRFSGKLGDKIAAGTTFWTSRIDVLLNPSTEYDIIRLVAIGGDGTERAANPTPDPTYAPTGTDPGYPANVLYTFTTPAQASAAHAPSKPTLARIPSNIVDPNSNGSLSITTLRTYADETELLDFAFQGTVSVQPKVLDDGGAKAPAPAISIEDPTLLFIDNPIGGLFTGRAYEWTKNTAFDSDGFGAQAPSTSPVIFIAGGFADPSGGLGTLTLVSATAANTEDPATLAVTFVLHQPTPAFKLKNFTAKRRVASHPDSEYDLPASLIIPREELNDPTYSVPGNISITFLSPAKPAKTYRFKITVRVIGGPVKDFESGDLAAAPLTQSAALSAAQGGPSLVDGGSLVASVKDYQDYQNTLDGSGAGAAGDADYPGRTWQTISNSGVPINNRATGVGGATFDSRGIRWRNSDKRLQLTTSLVSLGGKPAVRLGKLFRADDRVQISAIFICDTAPVTATITFALVDQVAGDMATCTATGFVISNTDATRYFGILVISGSYSGTAKQWLELRFTANPSQNVYVNNFQLDWGILYRDFKVNTDEQAVLNYLDVGFTSAGSGTGNIITEDDLGNQYSPDGVRAGPISFL